MSKYLGLETCPICKKKFIPAPMHIYKVHGRNVCSYTCTLPGAKEKKRKEAESQ